MAWSKLSVGFWLASGVLASGLVSACSSTTEPIKAGPTTGGTPPTTTTGGSATGGSGGASAGSAASGAATGGTAGGGMGMPPIDGKCGPNSVKRAADGLCYCQPATLTACSNGCGDLQTDPDRCGDCDTKCGETQACRGGKCTAAPTVLVPAIAGCNSIKLAVADGTLYWTDKGHGIVQSIATMGGVAKPLVTDQAAPTQIAINGTALYWLASGAKAIMTSTLAGATPTEVVKSATDDIAAFTFSEDGKTLYFSAGRFVNKTTAAPAGAVTEVGHEESGLPHALAVSGKLIAYPADLNGDVDIMTEVAGTPAVCASPDSKTETNSSCARVARSQGGLYLDASYIIDGDAYWLNGPQVVTSPADVPDGTNNFVATATNPKALAGTALTIVNKQVYFADDTGTLYHSGLTVNAEVEVLARAQKSPTSIAADDTNLYWANTDCSIMSVPLK